MEEEGRRFSISSTSAATRTNVNAHATLDLPAYSLTRVGSPSPLSLSLSLRSFSPSPSHSLPSSPLALVRTLFAESLPPPPPPPPIPILPPFRCALSSSMMRSLPLFLSPTHSPPLVGTCPDSSPRNINLLFEINAMSHPRETYAIAISFLVHPLEELGEYHLLCITAWSL